MELSVKFVPALTAEQLFIIHELAPTLWQHAYSEILSQEQISYMIEWMYSLDNLTRSSETGTNFFLIEISGTNQGFIALTPDKENPKLISLDKLYLHKNFHGAGVGQKALDFACNFAKKNNFAEILLHVNKNNLKAQKAYLRNGFVISEAVVNDIGNSFVMDDFVMRKIL
jgi:ribosomal protein S18 acetylase RimI-like enzyme